METYYDELIATANKLTFAGKGILAADESTGTIGKRLASINVENTEPNRQAYRELLFTTEGLGDYISGAILYEETLYQSTADGKPFVDCLKELGIIPGIKVDKGLSKLGPGASFETWCKGLEGLAERTAKYYEAGARFAKWRAVLQISDTTPSLCSIYANCGDLARYARICQDSGLVPIIEPEILMDGDHSIERCAEAQEEVLKACYKFCEVYGVLLEGTLLKPNMVVPGKDFDGMVTPDIIAKYTVQTLERSVPSAVPGVSFLSGGQTEEEASVNLSAINKVNRKASWSLTFSYGRAMQQSCLKSWLGEKDNIPAAQKALLARARANSMANLGKYSPGAEPSLDKAGTYEKSYKY